MFRLLVLMGFTFFFYHLHASGNLTKYINMKYAYLSFIAIFLLAILTAVQAYLFIKSPEKEGIIMIMIAGAAMITSMTMNKTSHFTSVI